jgi:hypothetical protein
MGIKKSAKSLDKITVENFNELRKTVYIASRDLTLHKTLALAVMKRINLFRRVSGKTVSTFHSNEGK